MKLCLGTVQFGLKYGVASKGQPNIDDSLEILNYAFNNGVKVFDTAPAYGNAEQILGEFISQNKKSRAEMKIASKTLPYQTEKHLGGNYYSSIKKNVEASLDKLKCDYLDYYLLHNSKDIFDDEIIKALYSLVQEGYVRKVGVSIYTASEAQKALECPFIECIQIPYNVFDRRLDKSGFFENKMLGEKTIFSRSVLLQGLLTMNIDEIPSHLLNFKKYLIIFDELCKYYNKTRIEMAVGYVKQTKGIDYIIMGVDNLPQLIDQIKFFKGDISIDAFKNVQNNFKNIEEYIINPSLWKK